MASRLETCLSAVVADTVRAQWEVGRAAPACGWSAAEVLAMAATVGREAGLVGAPALVMRVAAAVNVYATRFLPWSWELDLHERSWDNRALVFVRGEDRLTDFLWAEPWSTPLPASAQFAQAPGRVRMLDLLRPNSSREYRDGRHLPLRLAAVA